MVDLIEVELFNNLKKNNCGKRFTCVKLCYNKVAEELILLGGAIRRGWRW